MLALQAHPFLHAALDLSRLPVGSIPAFGSALPFNMVSWLPLFCGTDVGVGVHQLQSALPCRSTHAAMLSDLGLPTSAGSGLACRQPGQCLLKTLSAADQSSGSKCKSSPLHCSTLPMAVYLWRMLLDMQSATMSSSCPALQTLRQRVKNWLLGQVQS